MEDLYYDVRLKINLIETHLKLFSAFVFVLTVQLNFTSTAGIYIIKHYTTYMSITKKQIRSPRT